MRTERVNQPVTTTHDDDSILSIRNVAKHFSRGRKTLRAVDGVTFDIRRGEILGLAGESGSGKSTVARLVTRLLTPTSGHIYFDGVDIAELRGESLRQMRKNIQLVFQNPYSSLNPRMTVADIIGYPLRNFGIRGSEYTARVRDVIEACGLSPTALSRFAHEFSGGQRQRIGIARALVLKPRFIVLDEPISALDVSIQAQIINLLADLQKEYQLTYLFIAHDLSILRHLCDRVAIMYLGRIVEMGGNHDVFAGALHPYTKALLDAVPVADPDIAFTRRLHLLSGEVPSLLAPPSGCSFHTRCPIASLPMCASEEPALVVKRPDHLASCHLVEAAV